MSGWTVAWIVWIAGFAALEGAALYRGWRSQESESKSGRTLSAHLWAWLGFVRGQRPTVWAWIRRSVAVLALVWLAGHVLGGGTWWWFESG